MKNFEMGPIFAKDGATVTEIYVMQDRAWQQKRTRATDGEDKGEAACGFLWQFGAVGGALAEQ